MSKNYGYLITIVFMGFRNQLYNQSPMLEEGDGGCERCVSSWCSQQSATLLEVAWRRQLPGFRWAKGRDLTCFFLNNLVQKSWHMMMRKFISQMDPNGQFIIWWIHCFFLGGALTPMENMMIHQHLRGWRPGNCKGHRSHIWKSFKGPTGKP